MGMELEGEWAAAGLAMGLGKGGTELRFHSVIYADSPPTVPVQLRAVRELTVLSVVASCVGWWFTRVVMVQCTGAVVGPRGRNLGFRAVDREQEAGRGPVSYAACIRIF